MFLASVLGYPTLVAAFGTGNNLASAFGTGDTWTKIPKSANLKAILPDGPGATWCAAYLSSTQIADGFGSLWDPKCNENSNAVGCLDEPAGCRLCNLWGRVSKEKHPEKEYHETQCRCPLVASGRGAQDAVGRLAGIVGPGETPGTLNDLIKNKLAWFTKAQPPPGQTKRLEKPHDPGPLLTWYERTHANLNVMFDGLNCTGIEWAFLNSNAMNLTRNFYKENDPIPAGRRRVNKYIPDNGTCKLQPATEYFFDKEVESQWTTHNYIGDSMLSRGRFNAHEPNCADYRPATLLAQADGRLNRACCHEEYNPNEPGVEFKDDTGVCHLLDANTAQELGVLKQDGLEANKGVYIYNTPSVLEPTVGVNSPRKERTRVMRQNHGKGVTCIRAKFHVADNIDQICPLSNPEHKGGNCMEQGIFQKGRWYDTILRFSGLKNFSVFDLHDGVIRGLGIKIFGLQNRSAASLHADWPEVKTPPETCQQNGGAKVCNACQADPNKCPKLNLMDEVYGWPAVDFEAVDDIRSQLSVVNGIIEVTDLQRSCKPTRALDELVMGRKNLSWICPDQTTPPYAQGWDPKYPYVPGSSYGWVRDFNGDMTCANFTGFGASNGTFGCGLNTLKIPEYNGFTSDPPGKRGFAAFHPLGWGDMGQSGGTQDFLLSSIQSKGECSEDPLDAKNRKPAKDVNGNLIPCNVFHQSNVTQFDDFFQFGYPTEINPTAPMYQKPRLNPLSATYGSSGPARHGPDLAVKYWVEVCPDTPVQEQKPTSKMLKTPNFMWYNLYEALSKQDVALCMYMQVQEDPCTELIEDFTSLWKTPAVLVATINITKQKIEEYDEFCDNHAYHPFKVMAEHYPLGNINRHRQGAYSMSQLNRLHVNTGLKGGCNVGCNIGDSNAYSYINTNGKVKKSIVNTKRWSLCLQKSLTPGQDLNSGPDGDVVDYSSTLPGYSNPFPDGRINKEWSKEERDSAWKHLYDAQEVQDGRCAGAKGS